MFCWEINTADYGSVFFLKVPIHVDLDYASVCITRDKFLTPRCRKFASTTLSAAEEVLQNSRAWYVLFFTETGRCHNSMKQQ